MRVVIIANGKFDQALEISPNDILVAADGGARHCLDRDLSPNYVIGDMDSLDADQIKRLESRGARFMQFPTRKDQTDLELAVQLAHDLGFSEVLILGALGERWDQTIANVMLAVAWPDMNITLVDGNQQLLYLRSGEQITLPGRTGDGVSLIPLGTIARGIETQNLEYPLNREDLTFGSTRGISNIICASPATVSLAEGNLLCIVHHL